MLQQLLASNRFISLARDDPDDSDTDTDQTEQRLADNPQDEASAASDDTLYYEANDDTPYFLTGTEPPPREKWDVAAPINFLDFDGILHICHKMDATFQSKKEIQTPLGMDDAGQAWRWSDVGACKLPRAPPMYPTLTIGTGSAQQPVPSQVDRHALFRWIVNHLEWLSQYDTVYVFVDNRELPGQNHPDYWPYFAPWIKSRCTVIGPYQEKTTAIYVPISADTGLNQVHYTWAGTFVLEALCLVHPTVNFALADSDCVPTTLFEIAELVNFMTDQASRSEAMQHYTMASSTNCPPAVLLMTEAKAELNAGLIIVTGHMPARTDDIDMSQESPTPEHTQDVNMPPAETHQPTSTDTGDPRAHKSRRIANKNANRSPDEWVAELHNSRANFLATTAVPEDPAEALRGGLLLTPLMGCKARTPLDWTHAWAMLGEWAGRVAFPIPEQGTGWPRHGHGIYLRPNFIHRTPPFLTWARPIFEQGALSPMSVFPSCFPILCLPGDKLFQSKDIDEAYSLPPIVHAFLGNKVRTGKKLQKWQRHGLHPLAIALLGVDHLPPLWTHPTGSDFVRGSKLVAKPQVANQRKLTHTQVLLLQSMWTPVDTPNRHNDHAPWPQECQAPKVLCGQEASLLLPTNEIRPLLDALQKRLHIKASNPELDLNEILASHMDPKYKEWQAVVFESAMWHLNPADTGCSVYRIGGRRTG